MNETERAALVSAVSDVLKNVAQLVATRVESGGWSDDTYQDPEIYADQIIALVEADVARRLLSEEAVDAGLGNYFMSPPSMALGPSAALERYRDSLQAALTTIGIIVEDGQP